MAQGGVQSEARERMYETYMHEFGLDQPLYIQFINYFANLFRGELGTSFILYPGKVIDLIAEALPWTIALQVPAILVGWLLDRFPASIASIRCVHF